MSSTHRNYTLKKTHLALLAVVLSLLGPVAASAGPDSEAYHLLRHGSDLSAEEAAELEEGLRENPDDLDSRIKLLGYYFLQRSDAAREARQAHVMWLIENHPDAKVTGSPHARLDPIRYGSSYDQAKDLWLQQVELHANDPQVLGNAARFFLLHDKGRAETLLQEAQRLDPSNPEWPQQLGHLYSLATARKSGEARQNTAAKSLAQLEEALAVADDSGRRAMLSNLAKAAFEAGEVDKARSYALELLNEGETSASGWNHGNAIHHGNLILGRIALASDDVELAKLHLLAAGKTPGSPQLNSFGPNMMLAKELLERGEEEAVLEYFELCGEFWSHGERLEMWTSDVEAGRIPSFGANLFY